VKQIIIAVVLIVGIIGGAMLLGGDSEVAVGAESNNFYGQEEGIVTVTEYADFQCPACASFSPIVSQVKEQFKDQIRFEFRHFPLVQIHPNATTAHRAAQAAANQGKFWEMHDLLFQRIQSWSQSTNPTTVFEEYARELNLDIEKYKIDAASSETLGVINADIELGKNNNVNSTPTFLIDGEIIDNPTSISSVEGFSNLIQEAIDAKTGESSDSDVPAPAETPDATLPEEEPTQE
jgi:protein-disulfide isomerase